MSFFSKKLTPTESKYSTFRRESLAAYSAVHYFRHLWEGQTFYLLTDHKPLLGTFQSNSHRYSPRETRHLDYLLQFTSDIHSPRGINNILANTMSRSINTFLLDPFMEYQPFVEEQARDRQLQQLLRDNHTSLIFSRKILCDTSTRRLRPFVHNYCGGHCSHSSANASIWLTTDRFIWSRMKIDIRRWSETCVSCQKAEVGRHILDSSHLPICGFRMCMSTLIDRSPHVRDKHTC